MVIDFHSHVLPGMDDGSRDVETSLEMLRISRSQGVDVIVATPHFYASRDRVDRFVRRREQVFGTLTQELDSLNAPAPRVLLGGEVAFFSGISRAEELSALTIQGTKALLLEMPFRPWTQSDLDEVSQLIYNRGFEVILAHLERYFPFRENGPYIQQLLSMRLYVQVNTEDLLDWRKRGKLLRMIKYRQVQLLGSDCHSLHRRPPNLGQGRAVIQKRLGESSLRYIDRNGEWILSEGAVYAGK